MKSLHVPYGPSWDCAYKPALVRWRRELGPREEVIEWRRDSPRKQAFVAFTRALDGAGRKRTLAKSDGAVSPKVVLDGLQDFFETRRE